MEIKNEDAFTGECARLLRERKGMSQGKFWGAIGVSITTGCAYETGKTAEIPRPVRRLLYLQYVAGIPTDATADDLKTLARDIQTTRQANRRLKKVGEHIDQAVTILGKGKEAARALP